MSDWFTAERKRAVLDGDYPHIPLSVEEAEQVQPGEIVPIVRDRVWVTILGVQRVNKKLSLRYSVRDDRPRFVRRNPHGMDAAYVRRNLDRYGTPKRVSEQDAAEAAEASGYTRSPHLAVDDLEAVPAEVQTAITMESRRKASERTEQMAELAERQVKSFNDEIRGIVRRRARMGKDPGPLLAELIRRARADEEEDIAA